MEGPTLQHASHTLVRQLRSLLVKPPGEGACDWQMLQQFVDLRDEEAFSRLVVRHGPMVLALARRTVGDYQLAEDVFQATFLVLARKAHAIRGRQSLAAWLHSVAFRIALRVRKSQQRSRDLHMPVRTAPDPLDELTAREYLTIIDEELAKLPEKYRLPLLLCHRVGLTQDEAAERLHLCQGTLKGRLERGRRELRRRLARRGVALGATLAALMPLEQAALAVPHALIRTTSIAAVKNEPSSLAVKALACHALQSMLVTQLRLPITALLLASMVVFAVAWATPWAPLPAPLAPVAAAQPPDPGQDKGLDLHGDTLPKDAVMRLGTMQFRAAGATLALSPDGQTLIGMRGGKVISFWDVATGKLKETREIRTRQDWGTVLSWDGRWLLVDSNRVLEVWNIQSSDLAHKVPFKDRVEAKALSRDGKHVAAVEGRTDFTVRVWELASGMETFSAKVHSEGSTDYVAFTPDGRKLLASFASADVGTICWDLTTGQQLWQNKRQGTLGRSPAFSADGGVLLSSQEPLDLATGNSVWLDKLPRQEWGTQIEALPDGKTVLMTSMEGVLVWDLQTGKEIRRLSGAGEEMVVAPDGKTVITNSGALQRWDLASGKPLYADLFEVGHQQEVHSVVFSADGKRLVSAAADGTARLWDMSAGKPLQVWRAHEARRPMRLWRWMRGGVQGLDLSTDGRWVASAGSEERIRVWDSVTGKEVCTVALPPAVNGEHDRLIYHLRIGPEAKQVTALFGAQGFSYSTNQPFNPPTDWRVTWDLPSGTVAARQSLGTRSGYHSALSRDARLLAQGNALVHLPSGKEIAKLEGVEEYQSLTAYILSADGSLAAGDFSKKKMDGVWELAGVGIWESTTGKLIAHLKRKSWSGQLLFHPSGRYLAVNDLDGIHLWDIASAKKLWTRKLPERVRASTTPGTYSSCFAFSADGKRMATGHTDGTILLWEVDLPSTSDVRLDAKEVETLWTDLHDADAAKAWRAVWRLAAASEDAMTLFRKHLKPVAPAPADVTAALLADLNSDAFAKRDAAGKRLKELGLLAENALRDRLKAQPTLELRQRIEPLLKAIEEAPPMVSEDTLRDLRAVAALARMPSAQVRPLLLHLTSGVGSAPVTAAARAALGQ
jgi:RNA polymerase sigma factor (sigma-70 family)